MDVTLVKSSVYSLPSKQRVDAIVHDGSADMQLWPGPGTDTDLKEAYGDNLQKALDTELKQVDGQLLEIPSVIRVHPGRLHCDFLAWVATREPEPGTERSPVPDAAALEAAVVVALEFASSRDVERIAFPALGGGPGELPAEERLAIIVRAANAYQAKCTAEGTAPGIEEVLVCDATTAYRKAVKLVGKEAGASEPKAKPKKAATKKKAAKKTTRKRTPSKPKLTEEEIENARASAGSYSIKNSYGVDQFLVHPKFGVGKVVEVPAPDRVSVLFESGEIKLMVHGRG